mmetsp:Transcript_37625/g.86079  ORF Transcript_37625/g.86079 Transcript_37625/m.86079 type:complete len:86 (-) Transcript_37625:277-534(-)
MHHTHGLAQAACRPLRQHHGVEPNKQETSATTSPMRITATSYVSKILRGPQRGHRKSSIDLDATRRASSHQMKVLHMLVIDPEVL